MSRILILDNGSSVPQAVAATLASLGVKSEIALHEDLATSRVKLVAQDLCIAPHVGTCNARSVQAITDHLRSGGKLLTLGEPPFDRLIYEVDGRWVSESAYLSSMVSPIAVFKTTSQMLAQAKTGTDQPDADPKLTLTEAIVPELDPTQPIACGRVHMKHLKGYATFNFDLPTTKPRDAMTVFWARGTTSTSQLAMEWGEPDGSRWIATVNLRPEWRFYVLKPADFRYWYDSSSRNRNLPGDKVRMDHATSFSIGLALTHTKVGPGEQEFLFSDIGVVPPSVDLTRTIVEQPLIECLCPRTMLYPVKPASADVAESYKWVVENQPMALPRTGWSSYWRPMGSGIDKKRSMRFIPVVTARNPGGSRAGTLAAILLSFAPPFRNATYGYVGIDNDEILLSKPWQDLVAEMAVRMAGNDFLREAGSRKFTYDVRDLADGKYTIGARRFGSTGRKDPAPKTEIWLRLLEADRVVWEQRSKTDISQMVKYSAAMRTLPRVRAELVREGRLVDLIEQEIGFDGPRESPSFVTARDRSFRHNGQPWRAFGVNYMPTSGLARLNGEEFEHYLLDPSYDPEIVEADLERIADMGMNMISAFIYAGKVDNGNVLDLLRRARKNGLLVNLSLRPNYAPFPAPDDVLEYLIKTYRLAEKDEIMAYDIAWEPWWATAGNLARYGSDWRAWIARNYGSVEAACARWNYTPEGRIEDFPSGAQLKMDGAWTTAVADYRRFVDDTLTSAYSHAVATIREMDPNHLVSFRQSEGANPEVDPSWIPIDLRSVHEAVDFFSPEGYGMGGSAGSAKLLIFAASYAQGLSPGKPILWAEFGYSAWSGSAFEIQPGLYAEQAAVAGRICENVQASRAAGAVIWWFPGGYRRGEESDFGIVNPDNTVRPVETVIRKWAPILTAPAPPVQWKPEIRVRREDSVRGYSGIYERVKDRFWSSITSDTIPLVVPER